MFDEFQAEMRRINVAEARLFHRARVQVLNGYRQRKREQREADIKLHRVAVSIMKKTHMIQKKRERKQREKTEVIYLGDLFREPVERR